MGPSSGIINAIKLIEILIWIHIVVQRIYIIKVVKVVENCALCYDENYNIEKYWKYYSIQEFVFKILIEVIKICRTLRI
jgi:hypothetical protein